MSSLCAVEQKRLHKDVHATLDYIFDWSDWLGADNDTISNHLFTVSSLDLEIKSSAHDDTTATVWLAGGEFYTEYKVVCHIETMAGRREDRTLHLVCTNR